MRKILAQIFKRKGAKTQIFKRKGAKAQRRNEIFKDLITSNLKTFAPLRLGAFALISLLLFSCNSAPTDLRNYAPVDALVYLESNDLQKTLDEITESDSFQRLTNGKKDFSALKGVQLAVIITGFETNEKQVTDSQAILNFKPHFVAIADTHAWQFQAVSLTENQINNFVNKTYGGNVNLEKSEKNGGKFYIWKASDERKVFAFVEGSIIFFGNDEASIEKCLAARRGESENLSKNSELQTVYNEAKKKLAFGFFSNEGIKQIADYAGVSMAIETSEDELPRNFIAKVLPQILSKSIKRVVWTAEKSEQGITDNFRFETAKEISDVLEETIVSSNQNSNELAALLPNDFQSVTRYNLENPQIAWRSLLLSAGKQTDEQSAKILVAFSNSFFAPFGVVSGEQFLNSTGAEIITARFDAEGEKQVAIVSIKDSENLKKSLSPNFKKVEVQNDTQIWKTEDEDLTAAFTAHNLILGDSESVLKCLQSRLKTPDLDGSKYFRNLFESRAGIATYGKDDDSAHKIAELLGIIKNKDLRTYSYYLTETRFEGGAFMRKTTSDFGFVGIILKQFAER